MHNYTGSSKIKEVKFSDNYHTIFDVKENHHRKVLKVKKASRYSQYHSSNQENNSNTILFHFHLQQIFKLIVRRGGAIHRNSWDSYQHTVQMKSSLISRGILTYSNVLLSILQVRAAAGTGHISFVSIPKRLTARLLNYE